jgi:hypothetical protein
MPAAPTTMTAISQERNPDRTIPSRTLSAPIKTGVVSSANAPIQAGNASVRVIGVARRERSRKIAIPNAKAMA